MLLNIIKGMTSIEQICTVDGVLHPSFNLACYAIRLHTNDNECIDCLQKASVWAIADQLHNLFAIILAFFEVSKLTNV